ncbi:hypothetical protein DMTZ50_0435 [Dehalococcoides mccartyi]|nr:hypothetical protein [Dehalococcoides mccartyi]
MVIFGNCLVTFLQIFCLWYLISGKCNSGLFMHRPNWLQDELVRVIFNLDYIEL